MLRVLPVADVQPALLDALSDGDAGVRGLATSALYTLHRLDDVALDHRDRLERVWAEDMILSWLPRDVRACRAVVDLHVRRATPALVDLVQGAGGPLAIEAAVALARLASDDTGLPRVLQAAAPGGADRLRAVEALRYFGDGAAQTALHGLQSDPDPRIRAMAAASLLHRSAR
ncbi:MAG TPA: hypothetical protein VHT91_18650 [Kofleriaceae bacterium]|nr:hypothetical protein [Kofleriaceae bacterium]